MSTKFWGGGSENLVRRRIKREALSSVQKDKAAFAWQNPEDKPIIVTGVDVNITTVAGAAAILNVGGSANATADSHTLINSGNANAAGVLASPSGTSAVRSLRLDAKGGTTDYITGVIGSENANNLAGYAYITYAIVED